MKVGKAAPKKTQVPSVVGQTVGQAKQTLQAAGFTNVQFADGSNQSDTAFVTQQDPQGNSEIDGDPAGTTITLTTVGGDGNGNGNGGGGFLGGGTG
jgi:eukaryotic-like serine/threonine-protein kinase